MTDQPLLTLLQVDDGGVFLPENPASTLVWIIFIGIIAGLYIVISRTRKRAEAEFWDRKRRERDEQRNRPEPDDPSL
jgi:hypothetical protein